MYWLANNIHIEAVGGPIPGEQQIAANDIDTLCEHRVLNSVIS